MKYWLRNPDSYLQDFQRNYFVAVPDALPALLVDRWRHQAEGMKQFARTVTRRETGVELAYRVVTGDDIRMHWPELFAFYNDGSLIGWVNKITGETTARVSEHIQSAINLNILDSTEFKYRWHFDAVSYTAILYLTDMRPEDGGALRVITNCQPHESPNVDASEIAEIRPKAGTIVVMDGTRCYHSVAPILQKVNRLSVPLVFPNSEAAARPAGLDSYLYDRAA